MKYIKIKLTKEQLKQLNKAEKEVKNTQLLKRIQCVKFKDMGWTNLKIAEFLNVANDTITDWLKAYSINGIEGIITWGYEGRKSFLTDEQLEVIKQRNATKPFENASEAVDFIEEQFGRRYNLSWVQKLLKKNWVCHTKKQN
jgi:transposase